jgi:hypothetical protein
MRRVLEESTLMNRRLILVALLGSHVYAQFGDKPAPLSAIKIGDDLFVIYNDYVPGNATVLITNEGVILVDNKFPSGGPLFRPRSHRWRRRRAFSRPSRDCHGRHVHDG